MTIILLLTLILVLWALGGYSTYCALFDEDEDLDLPVFWFVILVWPAITAFNIIRDARQ